MTAIPAAISFAPAALDFQAGFQTVLQGDFTLANSRVTALIGGPSEPWPYLFQLLHGQLRPTHGHIRLQGRMIADRQTGLWVPPQRRGIGLVQKTPQLWPHLSIEKNIFAFQSFRKSPMAADLAAIIDHLGLKNLLALRPGALSYHQQWLVTLVRGMIAAESLLLVEAIPTFSDDAIRQNIFHLLQRAAEHGLPVLYSGGSPLDALRYADDFLSVDQGHIGPSQPIAPGNWDFGDDGVVGGDPGMVFDGVIKQRDLVYRLNTISFPGGTITLPASSGEIGSPVKIRLRCRDIMLALDHPNDTSINNIFPGKIREIKVVANTSYIEISVDIGRQQPCLVRTQIFKRLGDELHLAHGNDVYVMVRHATAD